MGGHNLIEIKSGHTLNAADSKHLEALAPLFTQARLFLIYGAPQKGVLGNTTLLSLKTLHTL